MKFLVICIIFCISDSELKSVTEEVSSSTEAESSEWNMLQLEGHGRHKRSDGTANSGIDFTSGILSIVDLGMSLNNYTEQSLEQHRREMTSARVELQELARKIENLTNDVEPLKRLVLDGQDILQDGPGSLQDRRQQLLDRMPASCHFGKGVALLRFFLNQLNNHLTLQNYLTLGPAGVANAWADSVLDLGVSGVGQILHDFHNFVIGNNSLFGEKPIFFTYEKKLDVDSSDYWNKLIQITDFLHSVQESGYAVLFAALNIKQRHEEVANVQRMAMDRLTIQEGIMQQLLQDWPNGTYVLPMTDTGCPNTAGVPWSHGSRRHDTENGSPSNSWSSGIHFPPESYAKSYMTQHFCSKTEVEGSGPWPAGNYCLFMKGSNCPSGFSFSFIRWDDENDRNYNDMAGSLPQGIYDQNTLIFYCCRSDGDSNTPIKLPSRKPFYLFKHTSSCQKTKNMRVTQEYFRWDTEDGGDGDAKFGTFRNVVEGNSSHKIYYCYYY